MNLNGTEYYYMRNAQGDIIGLYDKDGVQVVAYTYDSWGKPFITDEENKDASDTVKDGITGTLKDTVGVKNPYRYRGYRYDTETGLYYLNSRYYNSEWGRFINADGIIGQTGDLLGHNLFAYCKNQPISFSDPNGFYRAFADEETQRQYDQWLKTQEPVVRINTANNTVTHSDSGFSARESILEEVGSGSIDKLGEFIAGKVIKGRPVYEELDGGLGRYSYQLSNGGKFTKGAIGAAGTVVFTTWDVRESITKGEKVGAIIDGTSGAIGIGAGYGIGLGAAALTTAGAPALLVGAGAIAVGYGASMFIDYAADKAKDWYYGR